MFVLFLVRTKKEKGDTKRVFGWLYREEIISRRNCGTMTEDKNKEIVIHKEASSFSQFQCPVSKPTNYTVWALRIKTILKANGLWELIEPKG